MSWLDRIKDSLSIQTGEGTVFKPLWVNATKSKEYNVSEFEFVELPGTLVDRRMPKGNRYTLEIYFQGDNHLDDALAFYKAADDVRYWVLQHPFYGYLYVQPLSITQDNTALNVTKFTIPIVETITEDNPKASTDPIDAINVTKTRLDEEFSGSITAEITSTDINSLKATNQKNFDLSVPIIKLPEELQDYMNVFNQANSAIDTATASPILAMQAAINAISAPAKFTTNVKIRMTALLNQSTALRDTISGLTGLSGKQVYQAQLGSIVSTMCLAASLPIDNDYSNSKKVNDVIKVINQTYNNYLADMDALQSANGSSPLSFIPDFNSLSALNELINTTIAYLYASVIGAKKERSIICEDDTNIIILAHRFYGLDVSDKNLDELIDNNDLSLDEYYQIKKGRKITYYI